MKIPSELIANLAVPLNIPEQDDQTLTLPPLVLKATDIPFPTYGQQAFTAIGRDVSIGTAGSIGQQVGAGSTALDLVACEKGVWNLRVSGLIETSAQTFAVLVTISILSLDGTRNFATLDICGATADSGGRNGKIEFERIIQISEAFRVRALISSTGAITVTATIACHANRLL